MDQLKRMSVRTSELQCAVIDEFRRITPADIAERGLWEELLKSVRALANNSAESGGAQSRQDFIQKFHICLKESKECLQLLAALTHACPDRAIQLRKLWKASDEITAILVSSLKTAKANEEAEKRTGRRNRTDAACLVALCALGYALRSRLRSALFVVDCVLSPVLRCQLRSTLLVVGCVLSFSSFVLSSQNSSRPRSLNLHLDVPPFALPEADHAQHAPREVAQHNRHPDVCRMQRAEHLDERAQADRDGDL